MKLYKSPIVTKVEKKSTLRSADYSNSLRKHGNVQSISNFYKGTLNMQKTSSFSSYNEPVVKSKVLVKCLELEEIRWRLSKSIERSKTGFKDSRGQLRITPIKDSLTTFEKKKPLGFREQPLTLSYILEAVELEILASIRTHDKSIKLDLENDIKKIFQKLHTELKHLSFPSKVSNGVIEMNNRRELERLNERFNQVKEQLRTDTNNLNTQLDRMEFDMESLIKVANKKYDQNEVKKEMQLSSLVKLAKELQKDFNEIKSISESVISKVKQYEDLSDKKDFFIQTALTEYRFSNAQENEIQLDKRDLNLNKDQYLLEKICLESSKLLRIIEELQQSVIRNDEVAIEVYKERFENQRRVLNIAVTKARFEKLGIGKNGKRLENEYRDKLQGAKKESVSISICKSMPVLSFVKEKTKLVEVINKRVAKFNKSYKDFELYFQQATNKYDGVADKVIHLLERYNLLQSKKVKDAEYLEKDLNEKINNMSKELLKKNEVEVNKYKEEMNLLRARLLDEVKHIITNKLFGNLLEIVRRKLVSNEMKPIEDIKESTERSIKKLINLKKLIYNIKKDLKDKSNLVINEKEVHILELNKQLTNVLKDKASMENSFSDQLEAVNNNNKLLQEKLRAKSKDMIKCYEEELKNTNKMTKGVLELLNDTLDKAKNIVNSNEQVKSSIKNALSKVMASNMNLRQELEELKIKYTALRQQRDEMLESFHNKEITDKVVECLEESKMSIDTLDQEVKEYSKPNIQKVIELREFKQIDILRKSKSTIELLYNVLKEMRSIHNNYKVNVFNDSLYKLCASTYKEAALRTFKVSNNSIEDINERLNELENSITVLKIKMLTMKTLFEKKKDKYKLLLQGNDSAQKQIKESLNHLKSIKLRVEEVKNQVFIEVKEAFNKLLNKAKNNYLHTSIKHREVLDKVLANNKEFKEYFNNTINYLMNYKYTIQKILIDIKEKIVLINQVKSKNRLEFQTMSTHAMDIQSKPSTVLFDLDNEDEENFQTFAEGKIKDIWEMFDTQQPTLIAKDISNSLKELKGDISSILNSYNEFGRIIPKLQSAFTQLTLKYKEKAIINESLYKRVKELEKSEVVDKGKINELEDEKLLLESELNTTEIELVSLQNMHNNKYLGLYIFKANYEKEVKEPILLELNEWKISLATSLNDKSNQLLNKLHLLKEKVLNKINDGSLNTLNKYKELVMTIKSFVSIRLDNIKERTDHLFNRVNSLGELLSLAKNDLYNEVGRLVSVLEENKIYIKEYNIRLIVDQIINLIQSPQLQYKELYVEEWKELENKLEESSDGSLSGAVTAKDKDETPPILELSLYQVEPIENDKSRDIFLAEYKEIKARIKLITQTWSDEDSKGTIDEVERIIKELSDELTDAKKVNENALSNDVSGFIRSR